MDLRKTVDSRRMFVPRSDVVVNGLCHMSASLETAYKSGGLSDLCRGAGTVRSRSEKTS